MAFATTIGVRIAEFKAIDGSVEFSSSKVYLKDKFVQGICQISPT